MAMTLGGRAAEEIVFGEITTGASNDLEKVTETAKQMVMRYGMSERLGPRVFGHDRSMPFLGREFSSEPDYSDEIAREIDDEIRRIVEEAHQTAKDILVERRDDLDRISNLLLERETIDAVQFVKLLEGASAEEVFGARTPSPSRASPSRPSRSPRSPPAARARARSHRRVPASPAARPRCAPTSRPERRRTIRRGASSALHQRPSAVDCDAVSTFVRTERIHQMRNRAGGTRGFKRRADRRDRRGRLPRLCRGFALANNLDRRTATNVAKQVAKKECQQTSGCHGLLRPPPAPGQPHKAVGKIAIVSVKHGERFVCVRQIVIKLDHFTGQITYGTSARRCTDTGSAQGLTVSSSRGGLRARPSFSARGILRW